MRRICCSWIGMFLLAAGPASAGPWEADLEALLSWPQHGTFSDYYAQDSDSGKGFFVDLLFRRSERWSLGFGTGWHRTGGSEFCGDRHDPCTHLSVVPLHAMARYRWPLDPVAGLSLDFGLGVAHLDLSSSDTPGGAGDGFDSAFRPAVLLGASLDLNASRHVDLSFGAAAHGVVLWHSGEYHAFDDSLLFVLFHAGVRYKRGP
jgi:hypothetical protein